MQARGHAQQGGPLLQVPGEELRDERRGRGIPPHARRVARVLRVDLVAQGHADPRQELARAEPVEAPPAHPLGDERALVLGDRAANLQEQLVVRVLAHRAVDEHRLAASPRQFLQQEHLVDVFAREPVRRGDQDHVQLRGGRAVAQGVEARSGERRAAVAVIAEDPLRCHRPALFLRVALEPV